MKIVDREMPFWSENENAWVMRETDEWIVCVIPMIFNDRIVLASQREFGLGWTAGFCFDKSPGCYLAMTVAMAWDEKTERFPPGIKKVAVDARPNSDIVPFDKQFLCRWCGDEERKQSGATVEFATICAGCGAVRDEGGWYPPHPAMHYPNGLYKEVSWTTSTPS